MRTTVITVAVVSMFALHARDAAAAGRQKAPGRVKAAIARHTPSAVKRTVNSGFARLGRTRAAHAGRRALRSGGNVLRSPALHGGIAVAGLLAVGGKMGVAFLGGAFVYLCSRAVKETAELTRGSTD